MTMPTRYQHSQQLRGHTIFENINIHFLLVFYFFQSNNNNNYNVHVVVDYTDTMSAYLLTMLTLCRCSCCLRWHCVSVVIDCADTRFSQISSRKHKSSQNRFHMGPRSNLLSKKNGQKYCDTVPLIVIITVAIFIKWGKFSEVSLKDYYCR